MDCNKAETAMMQFLEKRVKPRMAAALARHVLQCDGCREMFIAMDEASEVELTDAPSGFTEAVMAKVAALPAEASRKSATPKADIFIRVAWGVSAILLGVCLAFLYNPNLLGDLISAFPPLGSVIELINDAYLFLLNALEGVWQSGSSFTMADGIPALLFVLMIGALLFILQSTDKAKI